MGQFLHILLGLVISGFFLWRFSQTRYSYQLVLAIWLLTTFGTYLSRERAYVLFLTGIQLIFFVLFLITWLLCRKRRRAEEDYCSKLREQIEAENDSEEKEGEST